MLWQEKTDDSSLIVPDDIVDLSFDIDCTQLPMDHAWHLFRALDQALPWLQEEPSVAIHSIFGAASGNGWVRPPGGPGELIQLSRRTRLTLRIPKHRITDANKLTGQILEIDNFPLTVGNSKSSKEATL